MKMSSVEQDEADLVEDFSSADGDSCSAKEINLYFPNRYVEAQSVKVTEENVYCSGLLADTHKSSLSCVLSDRSIAVIDRETFKFTASFQPHKKEITQIRFSGDGNLIYTSSLDGKIKIWDSRSNEFEKVINTNSVETRKPLTTFDVSRLERLVCAGTELIGEDSFLLFWDIRGNKLLGGYWESHSEDITCVKFNPDQSETLASAGCDGLINIFDVSQSSEADALTYCLNAEDTVNTFAWRSEKSRTNILAYTDIHSIQLWDVKDAAPTHTFSRDSVTKALKRNVTYECYPVPLKDTSLSRNPVILAGSGLEHEGKNCLRTLRLNEKSGYLEPHGLLVSESSDGFSAATQVASFSSNSEEIVTVREDGIVSLWKKTNDSQGGMLKVPKDGKKGRIKPY